MGQVAIINKLRFDKVRQENVRALEKLNRILFPNGEKVLQNLDVEEANAAIAEGLEKRLHRGGIPGNLKYFAETFSDGEVEIELTDSVQGMVFKICEKMDIIQKNISKY